MQHGTIIDIKNICAGTTLYYVRWETDNIVTGHTGWELDGAWRWSK